jgi:hypothetical protein
LFFQGFKTVTKAAQESCCVLGLVPADIGRQHIGDGQPAGAGILEHCSATVGQLHEIGATMVRVGHEMDDPELSQLVRDSLHRLPHQPHIPRDTSDWQHALGLRDGPHDLPPCAGQTEGRDKGVAHGNEDAVQTEDFQRENAGGMDKGIWDSGRNDSMLSEWWPAVNSGFFPWPPVVDRCSPVRFVHGGYS